MLETEAKVVVLEGEFAWIEPRPHSPCGHCDPIHGCRSMNIAKMFAGSDLRYKVLNPCSDLQVGDWVLVGTKEKSLLKSALLMYILPILALFVGAMVGQIWSQWLSIILGVSFFLLSLLTLRKFNKTFSKNPDYQPYILKKVTVESIIQLEKRTTCKSKK